MGVGFDAARRHDFPGGIKHPAHVFGKSAGGGHGHDSLALDRHVPVAHAPRGDYLAAADDQVQHLRPSFPYRARPVLSMNTRV